MTTAYGTVCVLGATVTVDATGEELQAWARQWPASVLRRYGRVRAELEGGDLVDLAVYLPGERYAEDETPDIPADELGAWIADALAGTAA